MIQVVRLSARQISRISIFFWFFTALALSGCVPAANAMADGRSWIMADSIDSNDSPELRISAPLSGGQLFVKVDAFEKESLLYVIWADDAGASSYLCQVSQYVLDPEQSQPWYLLSHQGVEYFAVSIFSGGARCCWEILVFRLDDPQLIKRGFASGASPQYLPFEMNCPLAARIYPVNKDGFISWEPKIECLVNEKVIRE
jgi:hypothetical protein